MILDILNTKLKEAMLSKSELMTSNIRMLLSAIHNREIEIHGKENREIGESDIVDVLKKELKKRKESALMYEQGNRLDLAEKENKEAEFIQTFLPEQISGEKLEKIVEQVLADFGAYTQKDFGAIIKSVSQKTNGQVDGAEVAKIVKGKIS